jgi:hypothetical protein
MPAALFLYERRKFKMLKKTITYTDYNGTERTENFYFNLSKAELIEMELSTEGGLAEMMKRITEAKDAPAIIRLFKELVLKSYGVKSDDGRRFIKSEELSEGFSQTEAYAQIFMELATDDEAAAAFINNVMPKDLVNQVSEQITALPTAK